jgi:hypothetical protein|nr:MAG TPA: Murine norovirus 1, NS1/2, HYDROLASE [Crassvirales sp.]
MITKKNMIIPIFDYKLTVLIFDKWEELEGIIPDEELDVSARAITISKHGASLVAVNAKCGGSIVHEAEHIKNNLWIHIGYNPQKDNDEVDAYLVAYIYNKIVDVYYKHLGSKGALARDTF